VSIPGHANETVAANEDLLANTMLTATNSMHPEISLQLSSH